MVTDVVFGPILKMLVYVCVFYVPMWNTVMNICEKTTYPDVK